MEIPGVSPLENPLELPGVAPPENKVDDDVVPPLLPIDYVINDESDDEDKDTDTPTQQLWRFIHPKAMPSAVRDVYNLCPRKQTDYVKENTNQSMSFTQFGNDLNYDVL